MLTSSMINTFLRHHRCLHLSWGMLSCIWSSLSLNVSPMAEWIVLPPIPTAADPDSRHPGYGRDDHSLCAFDRQHRLHSFDHPRFACTAAAPYILGMLPGSLGSLFRSS